MGLSMTQSMSMLPWSWHASTSFNLASSGSRALRFVLIGLEKPMQDTWNQILIYLLEIFLNVAMCLSPEELWQKMGLSSDCGFFP